ncbi:MAG: Zn-dependent hydrolase [Caldilineaceae bacterium]|nr:Zn-dependent hydrolase [Caldilineaceae bacterium]
MNPLPFLDSEQLLEDLETLGQIGLGPEGGLHRIAFNPADRAGRQWVAQQMAALGMQVTTDAAGNTRGRYPGREALPPLAIGSHTDTVPAGGRYDGALGVLAGLACVRALHAAQQLLRHPIEVINFTAEEATMAGGTLGSYAMIGQLNPAVIDSAAWDGQPVRTHLAQAGIDPARLHEAQCTLGSYAAFLELHVEQGATLEAQQQAIGVVQGIVGIRRYLVTFHGYANHAGTTTMDRRQDALVAAAPFITFVRDRAIAHGIVGTIGKLTVLPGAPNVIPGQVEVHLEIRGLDDAVLAEVETQLRHQAQTAGADFTLLSQKPPVQADPGLLAAIVEVCQEFGFSYLTLPSGAGHDAMNMAALCPMAMIFVPSQGGVSHSPDEYTAPADCSNGACVLLATLLKLDTTL